MRIARWNASSDQRPIPVSAIRRDIGGKDRAERRRHRQAAGVILATAYGMAGVAIAELAAIGNCNACHTVRGGQNFAGGLPVPTPFGTIYSSNITPDPETGIGRWSEEAFRRAMRAGVDREGRHLYPTFPYDHFTNVSDDDDRALYAFLMTREPVRAPARAEPAVVSVRPARRHRRLEAAVPAPRHLQAGPDQERRMESRRLSGRRARPLRRLPHAAQRARRRAGDRQLCRRRCRQLAGLCDQRAIAGAGALGCGRALRLSARRLPSRSRHRARADGGSGEQSVGGAGERRPRHRDLHGRRVRRAVAGSQAPGRGRARAGESRPRRLAPNGFDRARRSSRGLRRLPRERPPAALWRHPSRPQHAISGPDPRNLANIVLAGVRPVEGERSPIMPGFAASMNDAQIAALLGYLRSRFSRQPAWSDLEKTVAEARRTQTAYLQTSAGHTMPRPIQRSETSHDDIEGQRQGSPDRRRAGYAAALRAARRSGAQRARSSAAASASAAPAP